MPERKLDSSALLRDINRLLARSELRFAKLLAHFGIPDVSDEEVNKVLAEEKSAKRRIKGTTAATGHLSTGGPPIHRSPRTTLSIRDGESR